MRANLYTLCLLCIAFALVAPAAPVFAQGQILPDRAMPIEPGGPPIPVPAHTMPLRTLKQNISIEVRD